MKHKIYFISVLVVNVHYLKSKFGLICETTPQYRSLFCSRYRDLIFPDDDTTIWLPTFDLAGRAQGQIW